MQIHWLQLFILSSLILFLSACSLLSTDNDVFEPEITSLEMDEISPLGFSAADVINNIQLSHDAVFLWMDERYEGTEIDSTLSFEVTGDVKYYDYEDFLDDDCMAMQSDSTDSRFILCGNSDSVQFKGVFHFTMDDGSFDESIKVTAMANVVDFIHIESYEKLDLGNINGSYETPVQYTGSVFENAHIELGITLTDATVAGIIRGWGNYKPESIGTRFSEIWLIGSWNFSREEIYP